MSYSDDISSDDEIVWGVSDLSLSTDTIYYPTSDDDFVVLSRPRSRGSGTGLSTPQALNHVSHTEQLLISGLSRLSLNEFPTSRRPSRTPAMTLSIGRPDRPVHNPTNKPSSAVTKKKKTKKNSRSTSGHASASNSYPSPAASPNYDRPFSTGRPTYTHVPKYKPKKAKRKFSRSHPTAPGTGLGFRPIVDDISEKASDNGDGIETTIHEQAVKYITSFLTNPEAQNSVCHLTLLQSLIIELGLTTYTSFVPNSLSAAKALLKSRAFLNIREYLAVRDQGQAALQRVMHPSRTALIRDIRTKGNPASLQWVKKKGLQVFLVSCFH